MDIKIYFDGACWNRKDIENPPMGIGLAVFVDEQYDEELSLALGIYEHSDRGTNNIAEWIGCVEAMKAAAGIRKVEPTCSIRVYSDSQIIANQFNGTYAIRDNTFDKYYQEAKKYAKSAQVNSVTWIRREENKQADILSKEGLNTVKDEKDINKNKSTSKGDTYPNDLPF